jgi:hypothetical protein
MKIRIIAGRTVLRVVDFDPLLAAFIARHSKVFNTPEKVEARFKSRGSIFTNRYFYEPV